MRVIPNGLWHYKEMQDFTFTTPILGTEFAGITGGFTETGREEALELNEFRRVQRERVEEEVMESLRNLGRHSLFVSSENETPRIEYLNPIMSSPGEVVTINLDEIPESTDLDDFISRWENARTIRRTGTLDYIDEQSMLEQLDRISEEN